MFPSDKMAVIDAIDGLRPHAELIDVPVEPKEEGRGGEGVKQRWNPWKSRVMEIAHSKLLVDRIKKA
jgi:hypothetical protein